MNAEQEALLEQFREYLEQSASEPPLMEAASGERGADDEAGENTAGREVDLFTLFSELSALKNEIKRESRQLKEALSRFGELFDLVQQNQSRLEQSQEQRELASRSEADQYRRGLLLEVIDLRDRLLSNLLFLQEHQAGWLVRFDQREQLFRNDLQQGIEITLRNLDYLLERNQVVEVATKGQPFDPHTMRVEGTENHPAIADSQVLSTVRSGHLFQGEPLRTAQVIVNQHQALQQQEKSA